MIKTVLIVILLVIFLGGCASVERLPKTYVQPNQIDKDGIYHKVDKGETFYSIARAYNIDINELAKINHIPNTSDITQGQLIFIPGARKKIELEHLKKTEIQKFIWPVKGKLISYYGNLVDNVINKGIDILTQGDQAVKSSKAGEVIFIGRSLAGYGNTVLVDHGGGFTVVYSNLSELFVNPGMQVEQGEQIASIRDGDIFHLEIRKDLKTQNPLLFLP